MLPVHPALVHLPLALAVVVPVLAAGLAWAVARGSLPARAWVVVVGLQAILVCSAVAAMKTGEAEEDRVEPITGHDAIHHHEDAAKLFTWASGIVLVVAAAPLLPALSRAGTALRVATVIGSLVAGVLSVRTGIAGGLLVYVHGAASAYTTKPPPGAAAATPEP